MSSPNNLLEVTALPVTLTATGKSMIPTIFPGMSVSIRATGGALTVGRIYLFRSNRRLFLHRLAGADARWLEFRGDNNRGSEWVRDFSEVIGELEAVTVCGLEVRTGTAAFTLYNAVARGLHLLYHHAGGKALLGHLVARIFAEQYDVESSNRMPKSETDELIC